MNTYQEITGVLFMFASFVIGFAWATWAKQNQLQAHYRRIIKIRDAANQAAAERTNALWLEEVDKWKRLVDSTLENSYKVGLQDGILLQEAKAVNFDKQVKGGKK